METERAMRGKPVPSTAPPLTLAEKKAILLGMREAVANLIGPSKEPKAWARRLRDMEESGTKLNDVQAKAWREALRYEA